MGSGSPSRSAYLSFSVRFGCCIWILLQIFGCQGNQRAQYKYSHAVTSATPEASEIGMQILKKGGNAADAVIAITFALNVTEPAMSGIGGGTQVQIKLPNERPFAINGSTLSPSATPLRFDKDSLQLHLRTTIPSTVKVMEYLYTHYGSGKVTWSDLIEPSIQLIDQGFSWGFFRTKVMNKYRDKLSGSASTQDYLFERDQVDLGRLADAFQLIAQEGPSAFYSGRIAQSIHRDMNIHNGWITQKDLNNFPPPQKVPSIQFEYNGYTVYTQPEPCGGWVVEEILQKLTELRETKEESLQLLIEAINHGHKVRQTKAQESSKPTGETTHFSVMDRSGMCLSVTASINAYYGAGVANPDYGFLYNSYMDDFNFDDPDNLYALGPGKMAYSSMSPTIVMKDDQVVLIIGSPGSARIISTVAQLTDQYIRESCSPEDLLAIPRVHAQNNTVYFEIEEMEQNDLGLDTTWQIARPGSDLSRDAYNPYFGGVHAIVWTGTGYQALADPRRDGVGLTE